MTQRKIPIPENFSLRLICKTVEPLAHTTVALIALVLPASTHANPQRVQAHANFQAADVDMNAKLTLAEFTTFIKLNADHKLGQASRIHRWGMYTKAFEKADANGDNVVTKEEIAAQAQQ